MSICLIDTTVFCNILRVPNHDQQGSEVTEQLKHLIQQHVTLLLPMATIIETGNHVARSGSGRQLRAAARRFVEQVLAAIDGHAPWTPTPFFEQDELRQWLGEFPDSAMAGVGLADLAIRKEFDRQCRLHPWRRVFIWSLDGHLAAYDRPAK